jgi:hypothetical protein
MLSVVAPDLMARIQNESGLIRQRIVSWTNMSKQDETWAEFSALEAAVCVPYSYGALKQNSLI